MEIVNLIKLLRNPNTQKDTDFAIDEDNKIKCINTGDSFSIYNNMIDFIGINVSNPTINPPKKGLIFRLNEFYNKNFEQKIAASWFAGGGVGNIFMQKKLKEWMLYANGIILDAGCGDMKYKAYAANNEYIGLDYLTIGSISPWRLIYPDINATCENIPLKSKSVDFVLNSFVIEHVKDPRILISECSRVLKSGGYLLLAGPGDITPTHGEPYNYFNITYLGYFEMLREAQLEIVHEYFPHKSWMSILFLIYNKIVRNDIYNKNMFTKLVQLLVLSASLIISPIFNILAFLADIITPFDKRMYYSYMVLARKI